MKDILLIGGGVVLGWLLTGRLTRWLRKRARYRRGVHTWDCEDVIDEIAPW